MAELYIAVLIHSAELQWSRGISAAENNLSPIMVTTKERKLQWSRGISAAENRGRIPDKRLCQISFNGAAAFLPRKTYG